MFYDLSCIPCYYYGFISYRMNHKTLVTEYILQSINLSLLKKALCILM